MLVTSRLTLRRWEARDLEPFATLNGDPEVMRHFPKPLGRADSDALVARFEDRWRRDGIGLAVAERRADRAFIGMVGLGRVQMPGLEGAVEVGWRLARMHWGQGYATEAARAWMDYGFGAMKLPEIIAYTVPLNSASQRVMVRLGMQRDPVRDFEHPDLPPEHPLRPHLVFALSRGEWRG